MEIIVYREMQINSKALLFYYFNKLERQSVGTWGYINFSLNEVKHNEKFQDRRLLLIQLGEEQGRQYLLLFDISSYGSTFQ